MFLFYSLILLSFSQLLITNASVVSEMSDCSEREILSCSIPVMSKFEQYSDEKSLCCATLNLKPCFESLSPKCLNAFASIIKNIPQYASINDGYKFNEKTNEEIGYCMKYETVCT